MTKKSSSSTSSKYTTFENILFFVNSNIYSTFYNIFVIFVILSLYIFYTLVFINYTLIILMTKKMTKKINDNLQSYNFDLLETSICSISVFKSTFTN
jgi:hypothetical protein